ncbi:MAG: alpha/beta fold hydrolase [Thermoleophilaceae bacterium]
MSGYAPSGAGARARSSRSPGARARPPRRSPRGSASSLESALDTRDLVVFDQRGTGRSGALSCLTLDGPDEGLDVGSAVAGCAQELGPRRAFYTTQDSADDIESVRRELGVEKIALYGTSYGTKVALAYADRYPEHVERMVLDSVVEPDGPDPLSREAIEAVPRVLRELCRRGCEGVTDDPARDVAALVARLSAAGPLNGYRVDPRGRREPAELRREEVLAFLIAADFLPQVRTVFPGAVRGALAGDLAPLLRLVGAARAQAPEPEPPEAFSQALYLATICEDVSFPYDRDALPEERAKQARRAVERMPDDAFFPFDRETALRIGLVELCASWPSSGRELDEVSTDDAISEAPTLLLSGEEDLRTPLEAAQRTASRLPGASTLSVPSVGHSVLGVAFDLCPGRQLERFFTGGQTGGRCPDELPFGRVRPPPRCPSPRSRPRAGLPAAPGARSPPPR